MFVVILLDRLKTCRRLIHLLSFRLTSFPRRFCTNFRASVPVQGVSNFVVYLTQSWTFNQSQAPLVTQVETTREKLRFQTLRGAERGRTCLQERRASGSRRWWGSCGGTGSARARRRCAEQGTHNGNATTHACTHNAPHLQPTNHWEPKVIPPSLAPPTTPPPPRKSDENDGGDRQFQAAKPVAPQPQALTRVWGVRSPSGGWAETPSDVWLSTVASRI